ncbi:hypothetical protein [Henriciella aquimarina]|uniref:hypothetical protein n=1 Tax=Henriciella aquimarina TaxID=545261 RepID=UPI00117B7A90|nr:hypothetical protein [Henriciella aquimarina]
MHIHEPHTLASSRESLLRRIRRMGLILTGDQKLADGILEDAFTQARKAFDATSDISGKDIFKLGFDAFDDAVHRKGVVVLLNRGAKPGGTLSERVNSLSYVERVAIALLLVENMTPKAGAILSGRPPSVLEHALGEAMTKLEIDRTSQDGS